MAPVMRSRAGSKRSKRSKRSEQMKPAVNNQQNAPKPSPKQRRLPPPYDDLYDENKAYCSKWCFDIGTSKVQVSTAVVAENNTNPLNIRITRLRLQDGESEMPSLVGFKPDESDPTRATVIFGINVQDALNEQTIKLATVFSNLKQCSYLMDPRETKFADIRAGLEETQKYHERALKAIQRFDQITLVLPSDRKEYYSPKSQPEAGKKRLDKIEDVLSLMLTWILDYAKGSFCGLSGLTRAEIDCLFQRGRIDIGVAVTDVIPPSSITRYCNLLVRSGFPRGVILLSEAKSATVKILRDLLEQQLEKTPQSLGKYSNTYVDTCDIGHGTTDLTTIKTNGDSGCLRFGFPVESKGAPTGGKAIEDKVISFIGKRFLGPLKLCHARDSKGRKVPPEELREGFRNSISHKKRNYPDGEAARLSLVYSGPGRMPLSMTDGNVGVSGLAVFAPLALLEQAYDAALKPITANSRFGGRVGLLERHYDSLIGTEANVPDRLFYLIGGAAIPRYTHDSIQNALAQIPLTADLRISYHGARGQGYVADGGVIMLCDQELCRRCFHTESLGCIVEAPKTSMDVDRRVSWFFKIGQRTGDRAEFTVVGTEYDIQLLDKKDPADPKVYPILFNWPIARTTDETVGTQHLPLASDDQITVEEDGISFQMDSELCEFIGWQAGHEGNSKLVFSVHLNVYLESNVVRCQITIPKGGQFGAGVETRVHEASMFANVSHLAHEDLFTDK